MEPETTKLETHWMEPSKLERLKILPKLLGGLFGRKGGGGGLGGLLSSTKPIPVYVVNSTGALGGGAGAAGGRAGKVLGIAGKVAAHAAAAGATYQMATEGGFAGKIQQIAAAQKAKERQAYGQSVIQQRLAEQAKTLAGFKGKTTTYGTEGGPKALTQANVLETLKASALRQGATDATLKAMIPVLQQLTANLAKGPTVTVSAPGIDHPKVTLSRGAKK